MLKLLKLLAIMFIAVLLLLALIYKDTIAQVYQAASLFKEENLVESFRSLYKLQPSTIIHRSAQAFEFQRAPGELPEDFSYQGDTLKLNHFLEQTVATGLLVISNDHIIFEQYYLGADENTLFASHSMGKSFVSALMGAAIADGYIKGINDPVTNYVPELKGSDFEGVTLEHCLNMASGIGFNEDYSDWNSDINRMSLSMLSGRPIESFIAGLQREHPPGSRNHYVSINTEIIGLAVRNASGKGLAEYLEEKIWQPIGSEHDAWWVVNNGREVAMGGLSVSLRDYARFARLYLNQGNWNGEQLIPRQWVIDSLATDKPHLKPGDNARSDSELGYGYQWWIPEGNEGEFMAIGIYGQNIYINPTRKLIIVKTAADPNFQDNDFEHDMMALAAYREIATQLD